jgi:hypothetical protein
MPHLVVRQQVEREVVSWVMSQNRSAAGAAAMHQM